MHARSNTFYTRSHGARGDKVYPYRLLHDRGDPNTFAVLEAEVPLPAGGHRQAVKRALLGSETYEDEAVRFWSTYTAGHQKGMRAAAALHVVSRRFIFICWGRLLVVGVMRCGLVLTR